MSPDAGTAARAAAPDADGVRAALDRVSALLADARAMPMSSSVIVHRDEVLDLLDGARRALPVELEHARELLAQRELVVDAAQAEAERVLEQARRRAAELVAEQAVVEAARAEAERIVTDARARAEQLLADADDYCDRHLADFEIDLQRIATQVARGRERLRTRVPSAVPAELADQEDGDA